MPNFPHSGGVPIGRARDTQRLDIGSLPLLGVGLNRDSDQRVQGLGNSREQFALYRPEALRLCIESVEELLRKKAVGTLPRVQS